MFTSSGESEGAYFIRDPNFVNMFTLQKCLCWTDKGFVPKRNGRHQEPRASWQVAVACPLRVAFFRIATGDVKFTQTASFLFAAIC